MMAIRVLALASLLVAVAGGPAGARVLGGGNSQTDCYLTYEGVDSLDDKNVECTDGDVCDADGTVNGLCTFGLYICLHQDDIAGCVSPTVSDIRNVKNAGTVVAAARAMLPASAAICSAPTNVIVRLKKNRTRPGAKALRTATFADGRPRRDSDRVRLRCLPPPPVS